MDHRQGKRHLIKMEVDVYKNNVPIGRGKIRDISNFGAFLKFEPWQLSPHSEVTIIIPLKNEHYEKIIQTGMVIHRSSEGAGLMFLDKQLESYYLNQNGLMDNICENLFEII